MSLLGNRVQRVEDDRLLKGNARYVANIAPSDSAHVVFVRSPMAHANITSVDLTEAVKRPGVLAVVDAEGLGANANPGFPPFPRPEFLQRFPLASGRTRFVGEPLVAVVAETYALAVDAAEAVVIDYEPLDAVVDARLAATSSATLYDEVPTNVLPPMPLPEVPEPDFSDCEVVAEADIVNVRMSGSPIEPRVAAAHWHGDGTLTCWSATQGAHPTRSQLAAVAGLEEDKVRVIVPDIGGGFGAKAFPSLEECALGCLSRLVDRPVLWVETRTENLQAMCHGRGQFHTVKIGGTADGQITHYRLHNLVDAGSTPTGAGYLPFLTGTVAQGCYDIENVAYTFETVVTNTSTIDAFRGAGRPEAIATLERAVDLFAAEAGLDPVEVRRKNFISPDEFPFLTKTFSTYDSGRYGEGLRLATELAGYEQLRADQKERVDNGDHKLLGIGVASFVEITAAAPGPQQELGTVKLAADGSFIVSNGATAMGQGTDTTVAMLASDNLGVPMNRIEVVSGDTGLIDSSGITASSRTTQVLGPTIVDASQKMVEAAKAIAAEALEASEADVVFNTDSGEFSVAGTPAITISWPDIAANAPAELVTIGEFVQEAPTFPSGSNVAVVEVDTETGGVRLLRLIAADDAGTLIHPMLAEGQIHGGLGVGAAQALFEEIVYDADGNLLTSTFMDYAIPSAAEFPSFETTHYETPSPNNPLGAKGIGESGTVGSTAAIQNAVIDAVRHLGVRHIDMPMTPEKVWRAIQ